MTFTAPLFTSNRVIEDELTGAPNPKPMASDKAGFGKLASLYTTFSGDFGAYALDICLRAGCTRIADPFSGMGTLAEAARARPVDLRVSDISPFAVLSSAFRSAPVAEIERGIALFETLISRTPVQDERAVFEGLFHALAAHAGTPIATILENPSASRLRVTAVAVYLAALSRIRLYKRFAGSNPTWVKRPDEIADGASTLDAIDATVIAAREFARRLPDLDSANRTSSTWSCIDSNIFAPNALDAIVTSPPYANRTDYIRHYLPASELLLEAAGRDERQVRAQQIGTPLIRESQPVSTLPPALMNLLEEIRTHNSYASERYYYKGFLYYFNDMQDALRCMHLWLRSRGLLMMVVQDTYYKDVYVPTASLLVELATHIGFQFEGRRDWPVRQHLSRLSPHSRRVIRNRALNESVVVFSK